MAESTTFQLVNLRSNSMTNTDANDSLSSGSPRSLSPLNGWGIKYQTFPKKTDSKGIWDGYETKEEFITMHMR
ncbi:unnamed protein product [Rotaria sordida]|uniref:Uncharacterized protein n=1 Tax=Rotaria sordida TaxID=392033 RepID=A0A813TR95_9BILA|nr:unnamed protein product [Rotaria sordida]CAF0818179.1 unnamed protein product [Rotaria sordida]CAF0849378.1 unnamed protein product [Rotaria sordida]CAF0854151.1 unnamed protein product [Rotaria sordida]CAF0874573.1 unnamed protein product [Rotaria sordida]